MRNKTKAAEQTKILEGSTPFKTHHPKCNKNNFINKNLYFILQTKWLNSKPLSDKIWQNYRCKLQEMEAAGERGHVNYRKTLT